MVRAAGADAAGAWARRALGADLGRRGAFAPREVDREVVSITFTEDGVVENVERFGLEDGKVVAISRRVTQPNIKGLTFLRQLFGSIGRLRADSIID